jgi:hypothetical protein
VKAKIQIAKAAVARVDAPTRNVIEATAFEVGFDAPEIELADPLRAFSATLDLPDAEIVDTGLLQRYLPRGKDMRIARAHARFDAHFDIEVKDYLGKGSFALHASRLGFTLDELALSTQVKVRGRVHDWAWERGDLALDEATVVLTGVDARLTQGRESALSIRRVALHAKSDRFSVADPSAHVELTGSVAGGQVHDDVALNAFLPKGADVVFDTEPGQGRFDAELRGMVDRHVARGVLTVRGRGVGARGKKLGIRGNVDATADVEDWRVDEHTLRLKSSRVTFGQVAVRIGEEKPGAPSRSPDMVADRVELRASSAAFDTAHPSLHDVDYGLILEGARMDDVRPLGQLFSRDPLAFAVESGKARAAVDIEVKASNKTASGRATIELDNAGVRFHETHLTGDFQVTALVDGFAPELGGVNVSGSTITMRDVRTVSAKTSTPAWEGEVTLLGGALRLSEKPAFDGLVQLRVDDAKPILALALQDSLPKFLVGMLKAPNLTGQARVAIEPGRSAILGARVRGGDVVLIGNYVVAGDHVRGAVTVAKGPVSAGVKVDDAGTYVRLFELDSWMKEETGAALKLFGEAR